VRVRDKITSWASFSHRSLAQRAPERTKGNFTFGSDFYHSIIHIHLSIHDYPKRRNRTKILKEFNPDGIFRGLAHDGILKSKPDMDVGDFWDALQGYLHILGAGRVRDRRRRLSFVENSEGATSTIACERLSLNHSTIRNRVVTCNGRSRAVVKKLKKNSESPGRGYL
jgi:hypothetical protein